MNDTSPWAEAKLRELWAQRSPGERLAAACDMFDSARALVRAGVERDHPGASGAEVELLVFERIYRPDFTAEQWDWLWPRVRAKVLGTDAG